MKYRGIPACSVEINPYLHFVSTIKTRTYTNCGDVAGEFKRFVRAYQSNLATVPFHSAAAEYLTQNAEYIPPINHPHRWWSPGNLAQLVCLRRTVSAFEASPQIRDLVRMGVLGILVPVSNAKHDHVSLTFSKAPLPTVDVAAVLARQLSRIAADVIAMSARPSAEVTVHRGNSKYLSSILAKRPKVSAVITSPPYPNRFSYARETRPHLFFFDFIGDARSVGELETDAIGGTWGRATSVLAKGVVPKNNAVAALLAPYLNDIHSDGKLMASYVVKYFNDIYDHAAEVDKVSAKSARLAYVIGNSKYYGRPLPADEILAAIFQHFGFELERIDRMRKRQSKSGLYEAVVFMRRG
jgi:hypothetical protein